MESYDGNGFLRFALEMGVLRFGTFTTKAGRQSPYFFNAGLFNSGGSMARLGRFYAAAILRAGLPFDMIFGPAYKGIPLAVATTAALADYHQRDIPFAYNRKETKDHGEGGSLIGAPLKGRVLIIDDVISAGTSVGESMQLIQAAGARAAGVIIALDRQERGQGPLGAAQEVTERYGIPVIAIARLEDLLRFLAGDPARSEQLIAIQDYRQQYGTF